MSAMVDFNFYSSVYKGTEADAASFPALYAHASRVIGLLTRWQVNEETFPELDSHTQNLVKLAICSQVDFLGINGIEAMNSGDNAGFTVGKVTVHGSSSSGKAGAMSAYISPAAISYLELTGLTYPGVGVAQC